VGSRSLIVLGLLLGACAGPAPIVENITAMPSPQPGCTRVMMDVVNQGRGHGQVQLEITLRDASLGHAIKAERMVELRAEQRVQLTTDIPTPEGVYSAAVRVEYPD
jgi:hypothetical protein